MDAKRSRLAEVFLATGRVCTGYREATRARSLDSVNHHLPGVKGPNKHPKGLEFENLKGGS